MSGTTRRRPEHENPPELYYDETVARKYAGNTRVINIQKRMTERAIELLQLPAAASCHILDIGCGSGLSGEVLEARGHTWVGTDISRSMLRLAKQREFESSDEDEDEDEEDHDEYIDAEEQAEDDEEVPMDEEDDEGLFEVGSDDDDYEDIDSDDDDDEDSPEREDVSYVQADQRSRTVATRHWSEVVEADMGDGLPFRDGTFDGAVSISAVQWLCNVDKKGQVPQRRLKALFQSLYRLLRRGARAAIQFYPENPQQLNMITNAAMKSGFGGGVIVDFPHSARARKYFLVIYAGLAPNGYQPPKALTGVGRGFEDVDEFDLDDEDEDEEYDEDEDDERVGGVRARVAGRDQRSKYHQRKRTDLRPKTGTKEWVLMKKAQRRKFGEKTTEDTKYTMRPRKPRF